MFTGIVTDVGRVTSVTEKADRRYVLATSYDMNSVDIGASIACSGCCLTVVDKAPGWFAVDVSNETLSKTTMEDWTVDTPVNLERALKAGDELGGHVVSGHVDGVGTVSDVSPDGGSVRITFEVPENLVRLIAPKGSITVDGVSLTVNEVSEHGFDVNIIPHTQEVTTLGTYEAGTRVNLEVDMLARYVARLIGKDTP